MFAKNSTASVTKMRQTALTQLYRSPYLAWMRPGWRFGKHTYHACINSAFGGASFRIGSYSVRIPSEYASIWAEREEYREDEAVARVIDWCTRHPDGRFIDVGADIGKYSLLALSVLSHGQVVALDSSLSSLLVLSRVCARARQNSRLKLVHGFVSNKGDSRTLDEALRDTAASVATLARKKTPVDPDYVLLGEPGTQNIPSNTLDDLFGNGNPQSETLLKIDIEGAEGKALAVAHRVLTQFRPHILLSIHPNFLNNAGSSKAEVLAILSAKSYRMDLLSVDHEEHWWCEPI
jgi:FkbM family methyltransferase